MARTYEPLPSVFDVPWHLIGPWAHAQTHIWLILLYLDGLDSYIHAPELDSGHYRDCPSYDGGLCDGTCWIAYHKHQPYTHAPGTKPVPRCTCRYGLHPTIWCPTHVVDVPGVGQRGAAYTFRINERCPHHGIVALEDDEYDDLYPDGGVWLLEGES